MAHSPHLSERRRDHILVLVYLVVVPLMILTIVVIGAVQTRDARNEAKHTAEKASSVAQDTCMHSNQRDRVLRQIIDVAVSLTKTLSPSLTAQQLQSLDRMETLARRLRPQDCTPHS